MSFPDGALIWMLFDFISRRAAWWLVAPLFVLAGCSGLSRAPSPLINYKPEAFGASTFSRRFAADPAQTCEAARRALLGQGYIVAEATADKVTARKYFQPSADHHVQFEFRVVCAREAGDAGGGTIAFANGLQEQYNVRKVKESASLGVGGFGSLSLPVEGGMDSMVKVGSETVSDDELYERYFDLLAQYLDSVIPPETSDPVRPSQPVELAPLPLVREVPGVPMPTEQPASAAAAVASP